MSANDHRISRRDFVAFAWKGALALSGALGLGGLLRFFSHTPEPQRKVVFDLGPIHSFPLEGQLEVREAGAVVYRVGDIFTAISLTCSHLGCRVERDGETYLCPCHGSRFGKKGENLVGPANTPLQRFTVEVTPEGRVVLHTA